MKKFLGIFNLQYPINVCDVTLQKGQQLKMQSDPLQFEERISQSGKQKIKLKPTDIISVLFTEDDQYCIRVYHFYQEIWSFLINYNYVSLNISVIDITQLNYVIQFSVYLLEKSFQDQDKMKNDIYKDNQNQKDQKRDKQTLKLIDQYAKESFLILFEILNLTLSIRAPLKPKQETKSLDQFLVNKFRKLEYFQRKSLFQNLLIPQVLKNNQVNVTREKIIKIEQEVNTYEIENQSKYQMEQEKQNKNLFSVNEQKSFEFTTCQQPQDLNRQLFFYQAQAVNWMLYREQRINAQVLNFQDSNQILNKMWSQIKLSENEFIYFNELTGQFSENAVPQKDIKGGILADAMGLGKTICSLALILLSREMKQQQNDDIQESCKKKVKMEKVQANTLLVVELNVFEHWLQEIKSHTKLNKLEVYEFYKKEQRSKEIKLELYDIVITTYGVLKKDYSKNQLLYNYEWERIILDEAHVIKSKNTASAKAASSIKAKCRWCLTGTPIQNTLEDLFSLFLFLKIETFSDFYWFNHYINKQENKAIKFNLLHEILKPILLRRTKQSELIQTSLNLPNKQHFIISVKMSKEEQKFYNILYSNTCQQIKEYFGLGLKQKPIKAKYMHVFQLLSLLRLCCDHVEIVARKLLNKQIKQYEANKQKCEQMIRRFIENAQFNLEQSLKDAILQLQKKQEKFRQQNQEEEEEQEIEEEGDDFQIEEYQENQSTTDENYQEQEMDLELIEKELRDRIQQLEKVNQNKMDPQYTDKKYESFFDKVKNDDCVICREAFNKKNQVYYLGCTHVYCSDCFDRFERYKQIVSCPECRREIEKNDKIKIAYQCSLQQNIQQQKHQTKESQQNFIEPKNQDLYKESSKINEILKYVEYVQNRNEKVVIFTQWLSIMNFIEGKLRIKGIQFRNIKGKMDKKQRKVSIKDFFEKNITVMLISLKAGAYGINLCCANHVLLVDPWWNPAIEDQAVERVHRLGQLRNVQIISFVCENTIEERVLQLHKMKRQLFEDALHLKLPDHEFKFQDQIEFVMDQKLVS